MKEEKRKRYYDTDPEKIQKALAEIGQGDYFKAKEGKNVIRILPPWSKKGLWYKEATIHYGLKTGEGKERGFACLKSFEKDCPVCEKREELLQGDSEDKELADTLRPRLKYYANILDRTTGRVMLWGFTPKTLGILLGYEADEDHCDNKLTDPEEGFDVVIERQGTGRNDTKYNIRVKPKSSEIGDDSDWEDKMKDLDEIIEEPEEEKLQEIMDEMFSGGTKKRRHHEDEEQTQAKEKEEDDFEEGDTVSFEEDGEDFTGEITEINKKKGIAIVEDKEGDEHKVDLEDLEKEKEEGEEDEKRRRKERREKRKKSRR